MIELIISKIIKNAQLDVTYHWGDDRELNAFVMNVDNRSAVRLAYGEIKAIKKYPLIWLVVGSRSPLKQDSFIDNDDEIIYKNVRFIISSHTDCEWLNPQRWLTSYTNLDKIENDFKRVLYRNKHVRIIGNSWESYKLPNMSVNENGEDAKTIDSWDAIVIDTELKVNKSCLQELDYLNI